MAYASITDVKGWLTRIKIEAATDLSDTELGVILVTVEGKINTFLAKHGVATPFAVDGSAPAADQAAQGEFLAYLRGLSARGTAAQAVVSVFMGAETPPAVDQLVGEYNEDMKCLKGGEALPSWLAQPDEAGPDATAPDFWQTGERAGPFFRRGRDGRF